MLKSRQRYTKFVPITNRCYLSCGLSSGTAPRYFPALIIAVIASFRPRDQYKNQIARPAGNQQKPANGSKGGGKGKK
jgi:hypothetical protein